MSSFKPATCSKNLNVMNYVSRLIVNRRIAAHAPKNKLINTSINAAKTKQQITDH